MNTISTTQNQPDNLKLLAAQRQLYSEEKTRMAVWIGATLIIAVTGSGVVQALTPYVPLAAFFAIVLASVEIGYLRTLSEKRANAAKIQELFDCNVLELPWNKFLAGKRPAQDIIDEAVASFMKKNGEAGWNKLKNWYTTFDPNQPIHEARLVCQRENLVWDGKIKRTYATILYLVVGLIAVLLVGWAIVTHIDMAQFFGGPAILFLPLLVFGLTHAGIHRRAAQRVDELKQAVDDLNEELASDQYTPESLEQESRNLQNEIYHHRADNAPVWDWFYNHIKDRIQAAQTTAQSTPQNS